MTILFTHEACLKHDMGAGHPEQPARLTSVLEALQAEAFSALDRREAPRATVEQVAAVHPRAHVERLLEMIPAEGLVSIDADTRVCPYSGEAALRAAGAAVAAVDAVLGGEDKRAFCAVRPPGHHAEPTQVMGFCLFNNVAVGAARARDRHGVGRIAVIDFDVHHGNGTQAMFADQPDWFYGSTHQSPLYPGTGLAQEHGIANNVVNVPLPPMAGGPEFRHAMTEMVLPALRDFAPELVFISAGFDAHADDPLAQLNLHEDDFGWATEEICAMAQETADGRVISTLEGGYNLDALGRSAAAHVKALMDTAA